MKAKAFFWLNPLISILIPVLLINAVTSFEINTTILRVGFITGIIIVYKLFEPKESDEILGCSAAAFGILITAIICWLISSIFEYQIIAWFGLISFYIYLLLAARISTFEKPKRRIFIIPLFSFLAGSLPVVLNQILMRFTDEEFYVGLMVLLYTVLWLVLWIILDKIPWQVKIRVWTRKNKNSFINETHLYISAVLWIGLMIWGVRAYRNSFLPSYPVSSFSGITPTTPFICGTIPSQGNVDQKYEDVQQRYVEVLTKKKILTLNDKAFVALVNSDKKYANAFREELLELAADKIFTIPANSIKYDQFEASNVIYFYSKVNESFPSLFTLEDKEQILNWTLKVNQRAQTIEWVDWLYAFAFSIQPKGAYYNQDIGAGLYAQLLSNNMSDPSLFSENQAFIESSNFGWNNAFRVLDDSLGYQPIWITNALFLSQYDQSYSEINQRLSFDWILLQALPDGSTMNYNYPYEISIAPISLLGANQLNDGRFLWLANRAVEALDSAEYLYAQPGAEQPLEKSIKLVEPDIGSCLMYGRSGIPGNEVEIAPDKIVFREGWDEDDLYILLNLRFTGWHRYKAANNLSLIYKKGSLIVDEYEQAKANWLPEGRELIRDKRISTEQLNNIQIPRQGLDAVLNKVFDLFGQYSQDIPDYVKVEAFLTSETKDFSQTVLEDWHGWQAVRSIIMYHNGPTFILDEAISSKKDSASITWHFSENAEITETNKVIFKENNVEIVFVTQDEGVLTNLKNKGGHLISYQSPTNGSLRLLTIILPDEWQNAEQIYYYPENKQVSMILNTKTEIFKLSIDD